jgi:hypothetical protein
MAEAETESPAQERRASEEGEREKIVTASADHWASE